MLWSVVSQLLISAVSVFTILVIYEVIKIFKNFVISKFFKVNFRLSYGSWAVITGSTKGIGRAYADELAKRGINIFLISIGLEDLKRASKEISSKYGVETEMVEVDFTNGIEIYKEIESKLGGKDIGILVNNVGVFMERLTSFVDIHNKQILSHISVNITAATFMTKTILPRMIKNGRGAIVNMSCMSAACPVPFMTTYSASKSYIRFFSSGLRDELRGSGITVQTLTPFYVATAMTSALKLMSEPSFFIPSPEDFAASAITTLGYADETCGFVPHEILKFVFWFLPEWVLIRLMGYIHQRMNVEDAKRN